MKSNETTIEKPASTPLLPELDTGFCMLAYYLRQYIQSIRQLEKRPATR